MSARLDVARSRPTRQDRARRRRASILLVGVCAVVAQLSWGCHLPPIEPAPTNTTMPDATETQLRALIASAYCGTPENSDTLGKTGQSSLCLHCTTGAEGLRAARSLSSWGVDPYVFTLPPDVAHRTDRVRYRLLARGPPSENAQGLPLFGSRSV